jgi:ABC-type multidrug transport system ATPase subunit
MIGYCPQYDAIFDWMSVEEHLWFYAKIKGIPKELR